MKKRKLGLLSIAVAFGAIVLSSCTGNFCSVKEKSRLMFAVEPGVSTYFDSEEEANNAKKSADEGYKYYGPTLVAGTNVWQLVEQKDKAYTKSNQLSSIITSAEKSKILVPSAEYFAKFDEQLLLFSVAQAKATETQKDSEHYFDSLNKEKVEWVLTNYGYNKFFGSSMKKDKAVDTLWVNFDTIYNSIVFDLGIEKCANKDFNTVYKSSLETAVNNYRACITTSTGEYGAYGQDKIPVKIESKNWGYAWGRGGAVIETLIVYPVSALVDVFANAFAGHNPTNFANGVPQILALLIVTVIVRLFIFLVSFKSTLSQQKMTHNLSKQSIIQ